MGANCRGYLAARVRETADATGWLEVGVRLLWRSRARIGQIARGDLPKFGALQRDNTPTPACLNIYAVYMSGSTALLLELYLEEEEGGWECSSSLPHVYEQVCVA